MSHPPSGRRHTRPLNSATPSKLCRVVWNSLQVLLVFYFLHQHAILNKKFHIKMQFDLIMNCKIYNYFLLNM